MVSPQFTKNIYKLEYGLEPFMYNWKGIFLLIEYKHFEGSYGITQYI